MLPAIRPLVPTKYRRYIEPFLGGGAVLFDLTPKSAIVNDINAELVAMYLAIRDHSDELIDELASLPVTEETYYRIRNWDRDPEEWLKHSLIEKAARTIFLNRTAFNGLYRVNARNQFNASWGKYVNPVVCDKDLIHTMSDYFSANTIEFHNGDFRAVVDKARSGDFLYVDPPYAPLDDAASTFTRYTPDGFGHQDLVDLKDSLDRATERGAFWVLSNVGSRATALMFPESNYAVTGVQVPRRINTSGAGRGAVSEILVSPRKDNER